MEVIIICIVLFMFSSLLEQTARLVGLSSLGVGSIAAGGKLSVSPDIV
jgi:hypothetical protein